MSHIFGNSTNGAHWESSPNRRGTFDILTTCLITIALCVWTAVHMNIPARDEKWAPTRRKIGWLVLALLAPEYVVFTAWYQWRQAFYITNVVREYFGDEPVQPWWEGLYTWCARPFRRRELDVESLELGETSAEPPRDNEGVKPKFSREAGALQCEDSEDSEPQQNHSQEARLPSLRRPSSIVGRVRRAGSEQGHVPMADSVSASRSDHKHIWTMKHGFFAAMGGFSFDDSDREVERLRLSEKQTCAVFTLRGVGLLLEHDESTVLDISEKEIDDKSKSNAMGKTIVCLQVVWFFAQCLSRWIQSMPISLLELSTFAHGLCAILMMLFWWDKPYELEHPSRVPLSDSGSDSMFRQMFLLENVREDIEIEFMSGTVRVLGSPARVRAAQPQAGEAGQEGQEAHGSDGVRRPGFWITSPRDDSEARDSQDSEDGEEAHGSDIVRRFGFKMEY